MTTALVLGLRATGAATIPVLCADGWRVVAADDERSEGRFALSAFDGSEFGASGVEVLTGPYDWTAILAETRVDVVVPSPGVRPDHPLLAAARAASIAVRSEIDLAAERITAPMVAISGTNGKTTVTELVTAMLAGSGIPTACGGNIGNPLIALAGTRAGVVVAEVSSFQLEFTTERWHPRVAVLTNIADDHLDWHGSRDGYEAAKAKLFAHQDRADTLVVDGDDADATRVAAAAEARLVVVREAGDAEFVRLADGRLLVGAHEMPRALPHDRANARLAAEAAMAAGADLDAVRDVLRTYRTLAHRVELVAEADAVSWYDDSKATNPHATARAVAAFDSVVLCAGGLNKGLDLGVLAGAVPPIRAVVAFGAAGPEVARAFAGRCPVLLVPGQAARLPGDPSDAMDEVVRLAAGVAQPGDAVLLSPACASFDAYRSYAERGDDFARAVRTRLASGVAGTQRGFARG